MTTHTQAGTLGLLAALSLVGADLALFGAGLALFGAGTASAEGILPIARQAPATGMPVRADAARPADGRAAKPEPAPTALRRLPVFGDDIKFTGETAVRQWPVYLTGNEAVAARNFRLSAINAISDLPEASSITVLVNDVPIGKVQLASADKPVATQLRVPPGLLVEGYNAVRMVVAQRHRVDCSIEGTYELWTDIDPNETGFLLASEAPPRRLADLATLAGTGAPVLFRLQRDPVGGTRDIERGLSVLQSLSLIAGTARAQAEFDGEENTAPAIEVVVTTERKLGRALPLDWRLDGMKSVAVEKTAEKTTIYVVEADEDQLDAAVAALAKAASAPRKGSAAGLRALQDLDGVRIEPGRSYSIAELGGQAGGFDGRLFRTTMRAVLPHGFYPAGYGRAELTLQGGYASGQLPSNGLVVRVNGRTVSSVGLVRQSGASFDGKVLKLPYTWFKAGANTVSVEATLLTPADQTCEPTRPRTGARLQIGPETTLKFDRFALANTLPNIGATLGFGSSDPAGGALDFTVSAADPRFLDGVAAFVVRSAALRGKVLPVRIAFGAAPREEGSTIFVGPAAEAPMLGPATPIAGAAEVVEAPSLPPPPKQLASLGAEETVQLLGEAPVAAEPSLFDLGAVKTRVKAFGAALVDGFKTDVTTEFDASVPPGALVVMQAASPPVGWTRWGLFWGSLVGQDVRPTVSTVLTATDAATFKTAMNRAIASESWQRLDGASAAFELSAETTTQRSAGGQLIEVSNDLSPTNARLVVAGWLSSNTSIYLGATFVSCCLLGLFTLLSLRRRRA
jgi:hypothetical protein